MKIQPARIVTQYSYLVPGRIKITEHFFEVPLDYASPHLSKIHVFAKSAKRHIVTTDGEEDEAQELGKSKPAQPIAHAQPAQQQPPWLLYLQGGPGFECRAPQLHPWTNWMLEKGYQMLYLDQRGTGLSSPISHNITSVKADDMAQARYLKQFRADNIVRDCEAIRLALTEGLPDKKRKWSLMGQSFGGFCCVSYLSMFPGSLREAFITGGLPPLVDQPDDVYKKLFSRVVTRNQQYYKKFPQDVEFVKNIVQYLKAKPAPLPGGGTLTPQRFLTLGISFGGHGGFDAVHELVLRTWTELDRVGQLARQTLDMIGRALPFDNNVLYAILHESIYCHGKASNWSAERIKRSTFKGFDPEKTLSMPTQATYFTGEMIFPFMFDDFEELKKFRNVANIIAADSAWPPLYDRVQLAQNTVPVYAAVYVDDMYVDFDYSRETAQAIRGCKTYISNVLYHNAVGAKMDEVCEQLWKLKCDNLD